MVMQEFDTVDVVRLEVEQDPVGLVNMIDNPSGEFGGWGWVTPVALSTMSERHTTVQHLRYNAAASVPNWFYAEDQPVNAGQYVAFRWTGVGGNGFARVMFDWLDASHALLSSTAQSGYVAAGANLSHGPHQAPASTAFVRVRVDYYGTNAGANPTPGSSYDFREATLAKAATSGALAGLGYIPPVAYTNIMGFAHRIQVPRQELNVGSLTAVILSRTLDPSQSTQLRPGRRARLTTLVAGVWQPLIGGKLLEADVTYEVKDPKVPADKQARITVQLVDPTQTLARVGRPEGVGVIDDLPEVLEGAGVPWNINGSGNQAAVTAITTNNEGATALDQVALTRDTALGYAWMSRIGVLNVWDRDQIASGSPHVLDEDDYSDIDLSYSTKDVINEVQVTVQSLGTDGTTTETVYGPYRDEASIEAWGQYRREFTVTGLDSAEVDAYAAAVLAAAATPRIRVNSLTIPLNTVARVEAHALLDLYAEVQVVLTELGIDDTLRVTGLEHVIETKKWLLRLDFSDEGGVAVPTVQPPVQSGVRPDVGVIELFAGTTPPAGKLLCNGASYSTALYPHLFAVIGYTFGGSGGNFNVPNLTDRFPIGAGTKALGSSGGNPTKVIGTANLPPHTHTIAHTHNIARSAGANTGGGTRVSLGNTTAAADGATEASNTPNSGNGPGSSTPLDVMNPWLSLNFVIRAA